MSFARVYRGGVWFGFVGSALLLAVVLCWVDGCFDSWVLLGLLCFLRVTLNLLMWFIRLCPAVLHVTSSKTSGCEHHCQEEYSASVVVITVSTGDLLLRNHDHEELLTTLACTRTCNHLP